jgi:hypothetical protein
LLWSDAMELRAFPGQLMQFAEWVWRPAQELPQPDKKPHLESEQIYREQLEGRPVRVCLDVLGGVFLTLKELLEPYTIPRGDWHDWPVVYDEEADGHVPSPSGS